MGQEAGAVEADHCPSTFSRREAFSTTFRWAIDVMLLKNVARRVRGPV